MKKKKIIVFSVCTLLFSTGFSIYQNFTKQEKFTDLLLQNVEAIANSETTVDIPCVVDNSTCTYNVRLADGTVGKMIQSNLKNS